MPKKPPPGPTLTTPEEADAARPSLLARFVGPRQVIALPPEVIMAWEAFCMRQGLDEADALAALIQVYIRSVEGS